MAAPEAPPATSTTPDTKSLYMPLQNGSDVRGVAVDGALGLYSALMPAQILPTYQHMR